MLPRYRCNANRNLDLATDRNPSARFGRWAGRKRNKNRYELGPRKNNPRLRALRCEIIMRTTHTQTIRKSSLGSLGRVLHLVLDQSVKVALLILLSAGISLRAGAAPTELIPKGNIQIELQTVADGLTAPVDLQDAGDGSGRLFIVEQTGKIKILSNGAVLPTAFPRCD